MIMYIGKLTCDIEIKRKYATYCKLILNDMFKHYVSLSLSHETCTCVAHTIRFEIGHQL